MKSKESEFVMMNSKGIISQIFKKKYEISKCTGCYYWGAVVWLKSHKYLLKIIPSKWIPKKNIAKKGGV